MAVPSNEAPAAAASGALTPAMRQYHDAKRQYRDAIVFFRMGDFYEMFYEDALVASRALELTLTSRSKDAERRRDSDVRRAVPRRGRVPRAAGTEGLPRRDLRSGRGPEESERRRPARGDARGFAWHAARRQLPGRARAGIHDEPRARSRRPHRRGAARSDHWRFHRRRVRGPVPLAGHRRRAAGPGAAGAGGACGLGDRRDGAGSRAGGDSGHHAGRLAVRRRPRRSGRLPTSCARPASMASGCRGEPRRFRRRAGWSRICATRRKPTSRTSAPSVFASRPTTCSSIRPPSSTSGSSKARRAGAPGRCSTSSTRR